MNTVGIRHLSYSLGEAVWYRDLPDIDAKIRRLDIPDDEELWNWGYCRRAAGDYRAAIVGGFTQLTTYLATAAIQVDAVLACSPIEGSPDRFLAALADVLPGLAANGVPWLRVDDRECVNALQALADARALIDSGARNVLIVAAEKEEDETRRFSKYSVGSDFCLAVLVSAEIDRCAYELVDVQIHPDAQPGKDTSGVLMRDLETDCVAGVLADNGLAPANVSTVFYLNLFEPIAEMKLKRVGFAASQIYTAATKEIGHCYGADPLIDMHQYFAAGGNGTTSVLCASARAYVGVSLVKRPGRDRAQGEQ